MRILLSFLLLLIAPTILAQGETIVILELIDSKSTEVIRNAKVEWMVNDSTYIKESDGYGKSYFKIENGTSFKWTISHFKYDNVILKKRISSKNSLDTINFQVKLSFVRAQNIEEMVVTAPGVPVPVYKSENEHVSDFEILKNGDLLLLTYPKQLKKGSELVVFDGQVVKNRFTIPHRAEELIHDFRGNAHVVCENDVVGVHVEDSKVAISSLDRAYYMKYIAPIVDTNKSKMYFSNFNKDYPAFDYFLYDQLDSTYSKILEIKDDLMMELYRSEIKWVDVRTRIWAKNRELQTGIEAEVWVGANYFTQSLYYKELYAPLFHRNDTLFVFDYYKDKLRSYDNYGQILDSVSIYHHYDKRKTGWKKNLVQDRKTGQIFGVYERAGYSYIGWIDTETGEITQQVKLKHRYIENIAIQNNQVYYVYRPYESIQKKYLYKEGLPYDFGTGQVANGDIISLEENIVED